MTVAFLLYEKKKLPTIYRILRILKSIIHVLVYKFILAHEVVLF